MIFDDEIGLSEPFLYIAALDSFVAANIVAVISMYQRRATGASRVDPDYRSYFFVFHVDKRDRLLSYRQICCRHCRPGLADVTKFVRGIYMPHVIGGHRLP